jgi:radical SAM-linked protein
MVQSPVTKKFLVREKLRADAAAITDDCRLEDICFSCGVSDCPQRPWVKQPHAPIRLEAARATVGASPFGRRTRRASANGPSLHPRDVVRTSGAARNGAGTGVATSTRFRIQFSKGATMRFTSHLDLMRTWERTLRRADLPLAFSQGHHPHIRMSFGPPLPLGHRSRAEAFDLEFTRPPGVDLAERFDAVLPDGLRVTAYRPILFKTPSLMSQVGGASIRVRFPDSWLADAGVTPAELPGRLALGVADLLGREHLVVRRQGEDQAREFDARPSIAALETFLEDGRAVLDTHLRFVPRAVVRPEELVALMIPTGDPRALDVERIALWGELDGRRLDPFELLTARQ